MELILAKKESVFGATLLVSGCCIGAGMLGLPVVSAKAGFIPSTLAMLLCYFFATASGLLLLEATLWFEQKVGLLSIAHLALGKFGKIIACALFLFLYYCLFVAYIDGGGQLFANMATHFMSAPASREAGITICVSAIALITYAGTRLTDFVNRVLMLGMAAMYAALISFGLPQVDLENLTHTNWIASISAMPILLVCFGYQNLIPSLVDYLKRNVATIRFAIIVGNLIPFAIYFIWNFVILGLLPHSEDFGKIVNENEMAAGLLEDAAQSSSVVVFIKIFSFLAIFTSILPNAISFKDFLEDGLKRFSLPKASERLIILGLFLIPPTLFSLYTPHFFLKALGLAGAFADVLLLGILPATVVYIGRYRMNMNGPYTAPGGKLFIFLIVSLSIFFLAIRS